MSKPMKLTFLGGLIFAVGSFVTSVPSVAADMAVPGAAVERQAAACGPCGCLHVTWTHHRVLESTYGLDFDPRNFDQTEPYYVYGPVRAYPHFWCELSSAPTN
jgi:hypothetical protein